MENWILNFLKSCSIILQTTPGSSKNLKTWRRKNGKSSYCISILGRAKSTPTKHHHSPTCLPWGYTKIKCPEKHIWEKRHLFCGFDTQRIWLELQPKKGNSIKLFSLLVQKNYFQFSSNKKTIFTFRPKKLFSLFVQ